jgi:antibiotic biosynthesis monooxygenase (ABM) superfamily enzyme
MADQGKSDKEPINVVISYTVKPGQEKEFERVIHQAIKTARRFRGHEGTTVIRDRDRSYHLVYRFSDHKSLNKWLGSGERKQLLDKITHLIEEETIEPQEITGFEAWFTASHVPGESTPPRWKMLLVTLLGAYPVVVLFQFLIYPHIAKWHLLLRALALPVVILSIMTYVVMPHLTRWLRGWLYKSN